MAPLNVDIMVVTLAACRFKTSGGLLPQALAPLNIDIMLVTLAMCRFPSSCLKAVAASEVDSSLLKSLYMGMLADIKTT